MTTRLYYTDAYQTEFTAAIVDRSDDGLRVYTDATAFYPTSGGQLHDLGTLGGVDVIDVVDEDSRIAHVLAAPLPAATESATGQVDWTRRFDHMQQHTGQHLVSAVFEDLYGFKTVSVHFGAEYSTVDLDTENVSGKQLAAVEERTNTLIGEARSVVVTFEDAASAAGLRKPSDRGGMLRIVSIDGVDRSACGGTHVRSSAEIGPVLLRGVEHVRKTTRVQFVCGKRALRRARRDADLLTQAAAALSASIDDVAPLVTAQADRLKELENTKRRLERDLAAYRARARYDAADADASGVRTVVIRDAATMDEIRDLAQASLGFPRVAVVGAMDSPPSVLYAASEDSDIDAGKLLKARLARVGGKGGGSPRIAQGSVPHADAITALVNQLISRED